MVGLENSDQSSSRILMNIIKEFLDQMASAIIFLQGRQPHKDCLWWLRLQSAWQKQQEPYFISPLTSDYGRIISNSLILYGQNLIPNQDRYLLISNVLKAFFLEKNHGLGTCNDKIFAESATENHPTIYSAHLPKLAEHLGHFWRSTYQVSVVRGLDKSENLKC